MRWRILLIAGAVALVGLAIGFWASVKTKKPPPVTYMGRPIPPEGLVIDSQSKDPGDPRNAEEDFRRLYAAMTAYRAKTGKLPNPGQLMQMTGEEVEGISLRPEDLQNPDALKAEGPSARLRNRRKFEYMAAWARPRYDGRPKPAQPPEGERDVWIVSNPLRQE
ncbi:MAG TPA: hypothetical protein VM328_10495 [Fimbriimonadaceae bacterium]|nr:hypothetical protein [Fimbriimonadaceae bacterium]